MRKKEILFQLKKRQLAEDGLFAWGKVKDFNDLNGSVLGANSGKYIIAKSGEDLVFIPAGKELHFKNLYVLAKSNIKSLKFNKLGTKMELQTESGGAKVYNITRGKRNLKKMVASY